MAGRSLVKAWIGERKIFVQYTKLIFNLSAGNIFLTTLVDNMENHGDNSFLRAAEWGILHPLVSLNLLLELIVLFTKFWMLLKLLFHYLHCAAVNVLRSMVLC